MYKVILTDNKRQRVWIEKREGVENIIYVCVGFRVPFKIMGIRGSKLKFYDAAYTEAGLNLTEEQIVSLGMQAIKKRRDKNRKYRRQIRKLDFANVKGFN